MSVMPKIYSFDAEPPTKRMRTAGMRTPVPERPWYLTRHLSLHLTRTERGAGVFLHG